MGCRGASARFMAGRYVFPGGGVHVSDHLPWPGEDSQGLDGHLLPFLRAAVRETYEETGVLVGQSSANKSEASALKSDLGSLVAAYASAGAVPKLGELRLFGRAITPASSRIRYHARFFHVDADCCIGEPRSGVELENVRFYPADTLPEPMSDVTRFMLKRALANTDRGLARVPLYFYVGGTPRIRWS